MMGINDCAELVKAEAMRLGFSACGFVAAGPVDETNAQELDNWTSSGFHADMEYMARNRDLRLNPTLLMPGCRTLVVVALNYYPQCFLPRDSFQIAYYAYGKDYHRVVKDKLYQLLVYMKNFQPDLKGRVFCDTAPLLERYWAVKAGLGFIGRNHQLIIPGRGSYFFLGILAVNSVFKSSSFDTQPVFPFSLCGDCYRCVNACPTKALTAKGIDCRRCLSYLTIEHRGEIPDTYAHQLGNRIYGCDTCLKACPYNQKASPTGESAFILSDEVRSLSSDDWKQLTHKRYDELFRNSAINRAGYDGLLRNIAAASVSCAHHFSSVDDIDSSRNH